MKRSLNQATLSAYIGALLLFATFYPGIDAWVEPYRLLHAMWHVMTFLGAALFIYGLETLRSMARRHRRMINHN